VVPFAAGQLRPVVVGTAALPVAVPVLVALAEAALQEDAAAKTGWLALLAL